MQGILSQINTDITPVTANTHNTFYIEDAIGKFTMSNICSVPVYIQMYKVTPRRDIPAGDNVLTDITNSEGGTWLNAASWAGVIGASPFDFPLLVGHWKLKKIGKEKQLHPGTARTWTVHNRRCQKINPAYFDTGAFGYYKGKSQSLLAVIRGSTGISSGSLGDKVTPSEFQLGTMQYSIYKYKYIPHEFNAVGFGGNLFPNSNVYTQYAPWHWLAPGTGETYNYLAA